MANSFRKQTKQFYDKWGNVRTAPEKTVNELISKGIVQPFTDVSNIAPAPVVKEKKKKEPKIEVENVTVEAEIEENNNTELN